MGQTATLPRTPRRLNLENRRLITCEEFERLLEAGIFASDERLELLAGQIVRRETPMRSPHATAVVLISQALQPVLPEHAHLHVQLPLALTSHDEPYPDVAVVPGNPRDYRDHHPTTALLVVEIAEASLKTDREVKGSLYASVGIPEYWLVNLKASTVEVYRDPAPNPRAPYGAAYQTVLHLGKSDTITPVARPEVKIAVAELLS